MGLLIRVFYPALHFFSQILWTFISQDLSSSPPSPLLPYPYPGRGLSLGVAREEAQAEEGGGRPVRKTPGPAALSWDLIYVKSIKYILGKERYLRTYLLATSFSKNCEY